MFPLANEPGHRVATNGLRIAAHAPQQSAIGGGDDPPTYLGNGADRQLEFTDRDFTDLDVNTALGCDARDSILGVLGKWAADDVPPVVNSVDDQSSMRHGHRRDGVANIRRDAPFEVKLLVFQVPEQAPEFVERELSRDIAEPKYGRHGAKVYQIFRIKRPSWRIFEKDYLIFGG